MAKSKARRVFGIVRVSRTKGVNIVSPTEQRERIEKWAKAEGHRVVGMSEELDVSGGTPLARRKGLRDAVEAVERGEADVIAGAYFDRLFRSVNVQEEVVTRVDKAQAELYALDFGNVSHATASQWMTAQTAGTMAEYMRRTTAERTAESKRAAVMRGVAPYATLPFGFRKNEDTRQVEPDPATRNHALTAFRMRSEGKTIEAVRAFLVSKGHAIGMPAVTVMLANRLYVGELRFGETVNVDACEPIIPAAMFRKVQTMRVPRGRNAKSSRLLARLGVLRCASCDSRMIVSTTSHGTFAYRCDNRETCSERTQIKAEWIEALAVATIKDALTARRGQGRASEADHIERARIARDAAVADLETAIVNLAAVSSPAAGVELARLQHVADDADMTYEELVSSTRSVLRLSPDNIEQANVEELRFFLPDVIERMSVAKGTGRERVEVVLRDAFR